MKKDVENKLEQFAQILVEENKKYNLTAIKDKEGIRSKHFEDSLKLLDFHTFHSSDRVLDIGTGAGFPAIPLAIARPDIEFYLLDSQTKRTNFLSLVKTALDLKNVHIINGRCEHLAREQEYREQFDYVMARALAPLPTLLEFAIPFLKKGGTFFAFKAKGFDEEYKASSVAMRELKTKKINKYKYKINETNRVIVLFEKIDKTSKKYPRANGIPKKKPL